MVVKTQVVNEDSFLNRESIIDTLENSLSDEQPTSLTPHDVDTPPQQSKIKSNSPNKNVDDDSLGSSIIQIPNVLEKNGSPDNQIEGSQLTPSDSSQKSFNDCIGSSTSPTKSLPPPLDDHTVITHNTTVKPSTSAVPSTTNTDMTVGIGDKFTLGTTNPGPYQLIIHFYINHFRKYN